MTRKQELKKTLEAATSSVFDREPVPMMWRGSFSDYHGYNVKLAGWGDATDLTVTIPDVECDSYNVYVSNRHGVTLLEATVPLCALVAVADAMVRSRQAK